MQPRQSESKRNAFGEINDAEQDLGGHLKRKTTDILRRALLDQKRSLLRRQRKMLAEEDQLLAEREPGWEDLSATQTASALLENLRETEQAEIASIQAAIDRIAHRTYGICVDCHRPIGQRRLHVLPDAHQCGLCAGTSPAITS